MERFTTYCVSEEERILILDLINQTVKDLHTEIIRTDNWEYKEMLVQRRQALERIRQKMDMPKEEAEYA
jgi:hypothetical protein